MSADDRPSPRPRTVIETPICYQLALQLLARHTLDPVQYVCRGCGWPYSPTGELDGPCPLGQFAAELRYSSLTGAPRTNAMPAPRSSAELTERRDDRRQRRTFFCGPVPGAPTGVTLTVFAASA
jgi:hypothetical protein